MSERRKRQRVSDDGTAVVLANGDAGSLLTSNDNPARPRKDTNASAGRSLFVRSLPATATSEALTELFSQDYPLKHATVVLDPETKQSKGYGFVTFADADDARRARDEFNGRAFQGRIMKVEVAEPRTRDSKKSGGAAGKQSALAMEAAAVKKARQEKLAEMRKSPKLIIRNLPWSVKTPEQLSDLFKKYGKVKHATLPKVKNNTQAGFGFIVMRGRKNAEKALAEVNGNLVDGRTLAVDWAVDKEVWEGQKPAEDLEQGADDIADDKTIPKEDTANNDPNDADADVANFMKNFGEELESEDDDEEDQDQDEKMILDDDEAFDEADGYDDLEADDNSEDNEDHEDIGNVEDSGDNGVNTDLGRTALDTKSKQMITDNSTTLFVRNLPFTTLDADLKEHFQQFGAVRYARVVMDRATQRPKGTGFVCFFNVEDAENCARQAPRHQLTGANAITKGESTAPQIKHSILQDENADIGGLYTIQGRVLQVSRAVEKEKAVQLTEQGSDYRTERDKDKRKLYLLSEGTVASGTPLYNLLAPSEVKMREDSAMQRKKLIQNNPTLHLSLTRLSIRNLPRNVNSKDLKALAREAVVGFAKDVKGGNRAQLSKEEEARGGDESKEAERQRKLKGKGIVRQAKIVFEGREGTKVSEDSGAGRSRGYGFVEYSSHRWALMGLRWLNGHALENGTGRKQRLIVEFAIENAQVVQRRKEREEKARVRSKEVMAARIEAEKEGKKVEKKTLTKDQLMAKTRKGGKGKPGRPDRNGKLDDKRSTMNERRGRSGDRGGKPGAKGGKPDGKSNTWQKGPNVGSKAQGTKRKREAESLGKDQGADEVNGNGDAKLVRRQHIIGKKRAQRRDRKQGGS